MSPEKSVEYDDCSEGEDNDEQNDCNAGVVSEKFPVSYM